MVFDVRISIHRATWENQSSYVRSLDGDSPRTEVEMEIYEADSRINAAAYRTAFRAMGRAFFQRGNWSCPHFTINVVFFRLLRCVSIADSIRSRRRCEQISRENTRAYVSPVFLPSRNIGTPPHKGQMSWAMERSRLAERRIISSRSKIEASVFYTAIAS